MRIWTGTLLLLLAPAASLAGDCFAHPFHLHEIKVVSCAALDAANAPRVSSELARGDTPALVATRDELIAGKSIVVVEAAILRSRTVDDGVRVVRETKFQPTPWEKPKDGGNAFFFRTRDGAAAGVDLCASYPAGATVVIGQPTSCECDTGPHGMCLLDEGRRITDVPAKWTKLVK